MLFCNYLKLFTGDGVAERTKASVATSTEAGSKPRRRAAFFFGRQVTMSG